MTTKRYDTRLRRGRRAWNMTAGMQHGFHDRLGAPLREMALRHLDLRPGESVLDIGCGTGPMLGPLREAVGPEGRVVGVDYSQRMIARSHALVREKGWANVEVRQADAARTPHGDAEFDAAVALASISAMPDVPAAVALAHDALRPGGKLFVFDMRLLLTGHFANRCLTRLLRLIYRATAGFTGADVVAELRNRFATVEAVLPNGVGTLVTVVLAKK